MRLRLILPFIIASMNIVQSIHAQDKKSDLKAHVLGDALTEMRLNDTTHYIFKIEADYCNYCHVMNRITYQREGIIDHINSRSEFYIINLKNKQPIDFNGQKMVYLE